MSGRFATIVVALMLAASCAYDLSDTNAPPTHPDGTSGGVNGGGSDAAASECVPGRSIACDCTEDGLGVQTCNAQGAYGACDCTAVADTAMPDIGVPDGPTWVPTCSSNRWWTEGDEGEPEMYPGRDCVNCHATGQGGPVGGGGDDDEEEEDERGPRLETGGTVYLGLHEEDDCYGAPGAVVEIVGADGEVWRFTTNRAGNFYLEAEHGSIAVPYEASVLYEGREIAMQAPQTDLACANCHTLAGTEGAPGRIVLP